MNSELARRIEELEDELDLLQGNVITLEIRLRKSEDYARGLESEVFRLEAMNDKLDDDYDDKCGEYLQLLDENETLRVFNNILKNGRLVI